MLNPTNQRVPLNTSDAVNERIHRHTEKQLAFYATHRELIDQRLAELDREWDIERLIETEAPLVNIGGLLLGITRGRKWLLLPLFSQSMVLAHALNGYHPLLPIFRRLGFRTRKEIADERYALKAARGEFRSVQEEGDGARKADRAWQAATQR